MKEPLQKGGGKTRKRALLKRIGDEGNGKKFKN
jgi:hypothetical protein